MTDLEKAVSKWLPEMWTKRRCPSATPELGFRLLEALGKHGDVFVEKDFGRGVWGVTLLPDGWHVDDAVPAHDPDLLTAITKAAAALADKEQP